MDDEFLGYGLDRDVHAVQDLDEGGGEGDEGGASWLG